MASSHILEVESAVFSRRQTPPPFFLIFLLPPRRVVRRPSIRPDDCIATLSDSPPGPSLTPPSSSSLPHPSHPLSPLFPPTQRNTIATQCDCNATRLQRNAMAMQCNALKPEERGGEGGVMLALTPPSTEILCQSLHFPYMSIVFT